jgi:hypothetical protein
MEPGTQPQTQKLRFVDAKLTIHRKQVPHEAVTGALWTETGAVVESG